MKNKVLVYWFFSLIFMHNVKSTDGLDDDWTARVKRATQFTSVSADFVQTKKITSLNLELKASGHLSVKPILGEGVWTIKEPAVQKISFNSKNLVISSSLKGNEQPLIIPIEQWGQGNILGVILKFMIGQEFKKSEIEELFSLVSRDKNSIHLSTLKDAGGIQAIILHFHPGGYFSKIELFEKSKDSIEIIFKNVVTTK